MRLDEEFTYSIVILGGLAFAGLMLTGVFGWLIVAIYNRVTRKKVTRELYEQKERKNGQNKGGSRGEW